MDLRAVGQEINQASLSEAVGLETMSKERFASLYQRGRGTDDYFSTDLTSEDVLRRYSRL